MVRTLLIGALIAPTLGGCVPDIESIEAHIYEVCYLDQQARVSRTTDSSARGTVTINQVDLRKVDVSDPVVELDMINVTMANETSDFGFVESAHVDVGQTRVIGLDKVSNDALAGDGDSSVNLFEHASTNDLTLSVNLEGNVPTSAFMVSVDVCFAVTGVQVIKD